MKDADLNEDALEVRDPRMAALLVNTKAVVALIPFLGQERTLSEAAAQVEMKLPRMTYWVKKLVDVGILQRTRQQQRAGSPIAYYRSISSAFYLPYAVLPGDMVDAYRRRMKEELEQRMEDALGETYGAWGGAWGLRVGRHPTGDVAIHQVSGMYQRLDPTAFEALNLWDGLRLHPEDAMRLQHDLYHVLERYRQRAGPQTYLVHIAVAPTNS